ncbi:MAG: methionyl-tRNA formyltransferase, partial [Clostridia bacterium]|nr:methionyl-tRNA formyltransferase [Clostridia bacterium]
TVHQPLNLKKENFEHILNEENPDLIAVVAYGKLLPEYVLNYPKYGCINVHGSLLPKYRGAAPMQWCLINGESKTGITTMYMEKGLDTGDMLLKAEIDITDDDNYETIHDKLNVLGAQLLVETITSLENGTAVRIPQDDSLSCYSPMIDKSTAKIDWSKNAADIKNLIRGLYPFPRAYTSYDGKQLKIEKAVVSQKATKSAPGTVTDVSKTSFTVACGEGTCLEVTRVQLEGKKSMEVQSFLLGNVIESGVVLGK